MVYKSGTQGAEEEKLAALLMKHAPPSPMVGPLECRISAYMPIPASKSGKWRTRALTGAELPTGKPDLDNMGKHVLDVMSGVFFPDDRSIVDLILSKRYGDPARYEIELGPARP
jgi:Holliday junction resolvase RusA-like endonuclease